MSKLTDRDTQLLVIAAQCMTTMEINLDKFAQLGSYSTRASANTAWHKLRNKIIAFSATPTSSKDAVKGDENENENPGTPTPKSVRKKAATPKSAKSKAGTDGGGDGATDPKTSTAAPRMATFSKSTLAKFQAADAAAAGGDGDEQSQPETPTPKKGGRAKKAVDPKTDIADMLASKKRARGGKAKVDAIDEEGGVKDSEEPAGEASPKKKRAATGKAKAVKAEDSADEDAESNGGEGSEALKED